MGMEAGTQDNSHENNLEEELNEFLSEDNDSDEAGDSDIDESLEDDDDLFLDDDSDEDDSEGDESDDEELGEDSDQEDDSENSEDDEDSATDKSEDQDDKSNSEESSKADSLPLEDEIKQRIKPDYIPGSKEFLDAAEQEARAAVEEEFKEFDEFNTKHIAKFNYHLQESIINRKAEYQKGIQIIAAERKGRETRENVFHQVNKLLPSKEQKQKLGEALHRISHQAYLEIENALKSGDPSKLIDLAKKVAGPHGKLLEGKKPAKKAPVSQDKSKRKSEVFGSDILGY